MNKHTPGPWRYTHDEGDDFALNGQAGESIVGGCGCCGSPFLGGADVEADARLIAAAPELMEAVKAMIEWDDREQDHLVDFNARMDLCKRAFDLARAAIAKATGETP